MRELFLKDVDQLIEEFHLDQELDPEKLKIYFKELEDNIYNNMKDKFLSDKNYTE